MIDLPIESQQVVQRAAQLILKSKQAVALTGAGFSTPSGIPDFRSAGSGLWTKFLPMEVASLSTFRYDPQKFYNWLRPLASHMLTALPNPAHLALARLEQAGYIQAVVTQNIDGLHTRAGSQNVLEIHGTLNTLTCARCYQNVQAQGLIESYLEHGNIPRCSKCEGILKPDVILFEEQLPVRTWMKAEEACKTSDLLLIAGTSLEVMPSAGLPMRALENSARLLIINHSPTYIDVRADLIIQEDVARILPMITSIVLGD
jgi:NAD-dependent deacetylase